MIASATDVVRAVLTGFDWFVLVYFLILNSSYLFLIVVAALTAWHQLRRPSTAGDEDIFANPCTPPISVILPAYNEQECVVESARSVLSLRYPEFEVVIVDDGSTDETFARLDAEFDLVELDVRLDSDIATMGAVRSVHTARNDDSLVVVRKDNVGKRSDALNTGLNAARHPLVCCMDADSLLESDALLRVARPFVEDPDRMIATGGSIRAVNGSTVYRGRLTSFGQPRSWLARIQIIEYLRSFLLGRTGWSRFRGLLIISGAFGLYRRDLVAAVGGFDTDSLGEDADLVVSLHRLMRDRGEDYRIAFLPDPVCWTEVPSTAKVLGTQRRRWSHGLGQVLWKHRSMMANPRYGRVGMVSMPYYLAFELLGPIVELVGVVAVIVGLLIGAVSVQFALLFATVAFLFGALVSMSALLVEEVVYHKYGRWRDVAVGLLAAVFENIGYRQVHAWWRLKGLYDFVRGNESPWGVMTRTGFDTEVTS